MAFAPFRNGRPIGPMEPLLSGFTDQPDHVPGRPRAIATARNGALLVMGDKGNTIWRMARAYRN